MARGTLGRRVGRMLLAPVGRLILVYWRHSSGLPRRVPSLRWFTGSPRFSALHRSAIGWINRHFELIEANASWLALTRQETVDFCATSLASGAMSLPRDPPSVRCQRSVRRLYGFDGPFQPRLAELAQALRAAGWGQLSGRDRIATFDSLRQRRPPVNDIFWRPGPAFPAPAGLDMLPPHRRFPSWMKLHMTIDWGSGGRQANAGRPLPGGVEGTRMNRRGALYRELQRTDSGAAGGPAAAAKSPYEHWLAITIELTYYHNPNVHARPGRMITRIVPVMPNGPATGLPQ